MKQGNYSEAYKTLEAIGKEATIDNEFEKLFIARYYEAMAGYAQKKGDVSLYNEHIYRFYTHYPQLLPYSDLKANMRLTILGAADQAVINRLKACNINWIKDRNVPAPDVFLKFSNDGKKKNVTFYVNTPQGKEIVAREDYNYQDAETAGIAIAYKLFRINQSAKTSEEK
jgi:hypothetical protein